MGLGRVGRLALAVSIGAGAFATGCQPPPTEGWRSELVSIGLTGAPATGQATPSDISADGSNVLLTANSAALGFPGGNPSTIADLFLRDVGTGELTRITESPDGTSGGNGNVLEAMFGPDDRSVLLVTGASNLGPVDTNALTDVYLYDIASRDITLVSANSAGTDSGNNSSNTAWLSPDGERVAFSSLASDLGPVDANAAWDVYVRDLSAGTTNLLSVNASGSGPGDFESTVPPRSDGTEGSPFSADGRFLVFRSNATNLTPTPHSGTGAFVRDLVGGTTERVSLTASEMPPGGAGVMDVAISPDGTLVAFSALVADSSGIPLPFRLDLFVRELTTGDLARIATGAGKPVFSPDGRTLAFSGPGPVETGLPDTNGQGDVYLYDVTSEEVRLVSVDATGTRAASGQSMTPAFSGDGRSLAFVSTASDVVAGMPGNTSDLYLHDLDTASTALVSVNRTGNGRAGQVSAAAHLDAGGQVVAYRSSSQSLAGVPLPPRSVQAYVARITPYPVADLSVTADATAQVTPGGPWRLTAFARNGGPEPVDDVSVTVLVPSDVESLTVQAPAGITCTTAPVSTDGRQVVGCALGTLAVDQAADVVVSGTVRLSPTETELTVSAIVGAVRVVDPDSGNGTAVATSTVDGATTPPTTVTIPPPVSEP